MIWSKLDYLWEQNYMAAARYYMENGNLAVPCDYVDPSGIRLGVWLDNMRRNKKGLTRHAKLTADQINRLEEIGMNWDKKNETMWERSYAAAKEYYRQHGDLHVPATYKTKEGMALGKWVYNQRESKKLSERGRQRLSKIGMVWEKEDPWEVRFQLAKEYYERHGHLTMPQTHKTEDGIWLGKWLGLQRKIRDGTVKKGEINPGVLTEERIQRLDSIGMVWDRKGKKTGTQTESKKDWIEQPAHHTQKEQSDEPNPAGMIEIAV